MVIPAHNAEPTLPYCLAGLAAQTYPSHLLQVVVVDDGSDPPLVLPELRPENTHVLRTSESWGRAHACAQGAEYAEGDVLHWLDADMLLHHDEVEAQLRWHHLIDHAVVLGHKLFVDPSDGLVDVPTAFDHVRSGRAAEMFGGRWTARHDWVEEFAAKHDGLNAAAFHAYLVHVGASASVRRDFYETSGGMDSDLKLGEDVELGYRLAQRGAVFVPDNEARSWHLGRSTLMRRQEEVNRYNRPFVTDRITDLRHWRTKGRSYSVPWLQAVVDTEGESFESVSHTVDGLLRGSVADIEIVLLGDWTGHGDERRPPLEDEHLDARMLHAEYVGEPRVRFQKEVGSTAFPSAWRLELPAGWAPGRDTLRKLTREANNQVRGLLSVTMPDGGGRPVRAHLQLRPGHAPQGLRRGRRRRRRRHHRLLVVRRPRGGLHPRVVARAVVERRPQPGRRTPAPGPLRGGRAARAPPSRAAGPTGPQALAGRGEPQGHRPPRPRGAAPPAGLTRPTGEADP